MRILVVNVRLGGAVGQGQERPPVGVIPSAALRTGSAEADGAGPAMADLGQPVGVVEGGLYLHDFRIL